MAELADALDLGSNAERRAGSSPVPGTTSRSSSSRADYGRERAAAVDAVIHGGRRTPRKTPQKCAVSYFQDAERAQPFQVEPVVVSREGASGSDRPTQDWPLLILLLSCLP